MNNKTISKLILASFGIVVLGFWIIKLGPVSMIKMLAFLGITLCVSMVLAWAIIQLID